MREEAEVYRTTVRLEQPIYDLLVRVARENHLHTPRRGPNIAGAIRWLIMDWEQMRRTAGLRGLAAEDPSAGAGGLAS
ncbi:MAG: hypothetical protein JXA09_11950 [Anaerolineae bacterium]|nr:hypothetical protein [Anaerolineae bacterium]